MPAFHLSLFSALLMVLDVFVYAQYILGIHHSVTVYILDNVFTTVVYFFGVNLVWLYVPLSVKAREVPCVACIADDRIAVA